MDVNRIVKAGFKEVFVEDEAVGIYKIGLQQLRKELICEIESVFVTGLQRKGFDFNNWYELAEFVKERCRATDNIMLKERVYYVDDIPFLIHYYKVTVDRQTDRNKITASGGSYRYL